MLYNHVTYSLSKLDLKMVESIPQGGNWKDIPCTIPSKRLEKIRITGGRTTLYGRLRWDKPSYTISTYFNRPGNGSYIHPIENRVLSAREAARIQSFPDSYVFCGSKTSLCKQIGNAVPPLLAYFIAKKIKNTTKTKNVLDLFCGAGGLSKGFEWAGFQIVAANDNFKSACETYKANHKKTILIEGDISNQDTKERLLRAIDNRKIDVIIGGPPCQGFSHAGKRLIDDPRNHLYKEFVELVSRVKPRVILMENVEGILTINHGKTFQSVKESFQKLGYRLHGKKIHSEKFGVPQKRKRVIIIGLLEGDPTLCYPSDIITEEKFYLNVKTAIDNLPPLQINGGEMIINISLKPNNYYQKFLAGLISIEVFSQELTKGF